MHSVFENAPLGEVAQRAGGVEPCQFMFSSKSVNLVKGLTGLTGLTAAAVWMWSQVNFDRDSKRHLSAEEMPPKI